MPNYPSTSFEPTDFDPIANPQALAFLATSTHGVFVVDADWSLTYLSPNSERSFGKPCRRIDREKVVGRISNHLRARCSNC